MGIVHTRQMVQLRLPPFWKHVTFKTFQRTLGACSSEHGSLRDSLRRERCFLLGILRALECFLRFLKFWKLRRFCSQAYARPRSFEDRGDLLDSILGQTSSFFAFFCQWHPSAFSKPNCWKACLKDRSPRPSAQLRAPSNMMSRERPVLNCKRSNMFQHHGRKSHSHRVCRLRLLRSAPSSADLQRPWLKCLHKVWPDRARESVRLWTLDISRFCLYKTSTSTRTQKAQQTWRRRSPKSTVGEKACFFLTSPGVGLQKRLPRMPKSWWKWCDRWIGGSVPFL